MRSTVALGEERREEIRKGASCGRCDIVIGLCLILFNKVYSHCCSFVVAVPLLKREAERKGKAAANTGPSPNSEARANSLAEETAWPARGSGSLH
ncbi:hypothetical protein T4B_4994 [Trichinella pseudospiralis]|uniref:Uncharacterized protein n=1 Tax=Trichinella pseudospiralis TaxID=6337 RepID=A0A0V1DUX7_TRIPS|nr:hypothetical protein T4A_1015 [Trichinella pseudospiralis]KRY99667.1 hypothetical protein T4B_4994 [Trichinella pseudospiralis]